ncbi:hypothetical protein P171DRAFT_437722 [Karstenula rhodostoma CBS 690.94]|uniref:RING-type domain-containing protein n=1 Tax=Karstenula rhodostoma CBS 690.94 TaxID=1392251 RepID=A0A9P4P5B7_9PLEO|nr:hypothetical protein P171DRAFT_437722 [Karstenula rhodostoma CBS 690.94]
MPYHTPRKKFKPPPPPPPPPLEDYEVEVTRAPQGHFDVESVPDAAADEWHQATPGDLDTLPMTSAGVVLVRLETFGGIDFAPARVVAYRDDAVQVAWLYTRQDAREVAPRGARLRWPAGRRYMLSTHLQVVSVDDLVGPGPPPAALATFDPSQILYLYEMCIVGFDENNQNCGLAKCFRDIAKALHFSQLNRTAANSADDSELRDKRCGACDTIIDLASDVYVFDACKALCCAPCHTTHARCRTHPAAQPQTHRLYHLECTICMNEIRAQWMCDVGCGHAQCVVCLEKSVSSACPFCKKNIDFMGLQLLVHA